jgi:uncharacterized SAM-binding protein YcdF (DUF218 family)
MKSPPAARRMTLPCASHLLVITLASLLALLYLVTTEVGSTAAIALLDGRREQPASGTEHAIVVLTGGAEARLTKAAELQRKTALPIIVAGHNAGYYLLVLRRQGAHALELEDGSTDTEQNAAYVSCIARRRQISSVYLITDTAHMRRAIGWFRTYGMDVTAIDAGPPYPGASGWPLLPSRLGWARTRAAIHEYLGLFDLWIAGQTHRHLACAADGTQSQ